MEDENLDVRDNLVVDDDAVVKKKRKRKKRKSPKSLKNFDDEYQSTPEGVRVYRKHQENIIESETFVENLESSKVTLRKEKIIMSGKSKSISKSESISEGTTLSSSSNIDSVSEIGDKVQVEVFHNKSSLIIENDQMISVNYLLPKLGQCLLLLCQLLQFCQNCIVTTTILMKNIIMESVQDWCSSIYKQLTGSKSTKYSRRRKIRN